MDIQTSSLSRARRMLETQGRFPGGALPGDISDSWQRSLESGLDPLAASGDFVQSEQEFVETRSKHSKLIHYAKPELELLFDQIAGSNYMIALGSPEGVVLETLTDNQFIASAAGKAVIPGSIWTEELRGTNGLGLSISTQRPAQVYGGEHFLRAHSDVSCISAPIFDGRGALAGVLDASTGSSARQQHTAALVQMSASNIENCLIRSGYADNIVIQFHPRPEYLSTLSVGMLVLSDDKKVFAVNRKGALYLTGFKNLIGAHFDDIFETGFDDVSNQLVRGETLRVRDRFGSAVSMRCVANRASFSLAARQTMPVQTPQVVHKPKTENLFKDAVFEDAGLRRQIVALPEATKRRLSICIQGETGTGKELVARLAHTASERSGDFVAINSKTLTATNFEDILFGGNTGQSGLVSKAEGGTLFLDDVSFLPQEAQSALSRLIDLGEYRRNGSDKVIKADILWVSSTSESLSNSVQKELLSSDFRYRLEGYTVKLPALRERSDLLALAKRILSFINPVLMLSTEAQDLLQRYQWPGNIHELRTQLERASLQAQKNQLTASDFEGLVIHDILAKPDAEIACDCCRGVKWKQQQCIAIRSAVSEYGGNVAEAARQMGMSRTTIYKHLRTD